MIFGYNTSHIGHHVFELQNKVVIQSKLNKPFNRFIKRILDITLSSLFIILIAPWLFPIVSLIIVIESKGSAFFIQKRTGLKRKSFYCIKFRTMVKNKDANRLQVQINDKRITKFGKILRESHIDELPQVINVLIGDMSIVGPRPHMLRHNVEYANYSPNYHLRHMVKPGMTGLAQVRGFHGMILGKENFQNRLNSDIEYIKRWSFLGDIEIFILTTFKVIFKSNEK